jgi:restriction system protein
VLPAFLAVIPSAASARDVLLHLFWIVPLLLLIAFISSPRFRGDIAENRTRRILNAGLEKKRYTVLNNVVLPAGGGTILIDHLVVSRFGIFVIESHYARGWVSGGEFQDRWKQAHWGRSKRFENPVHQNAVQAQTLGGLLNLPSVKMHPIVVLTGHKGMKTEVPANLVQCEKLIAYIRKKGTHILEPEQADRLLKGIEEARIRPDGRFHLNQWSVLTFFLMVILFAGIWLSFREEFQAMIDTFSERQEQRASPDSFHADGSRKTEQELWEDSLICAWSEDSGRCACYEPAGTRVELELSRCRSLAERGSVLEQ